MSFIVSIPLLHRKTPTRLMAASLVASLVACSSTPSGQADKRDLPLPTQWNQAPQASARLPDATWWQQFESPQLSRLVQAALAESPDLRVAIERVKQAQAQLGVSRVAQLPSANLSGSTASRQTDGGNGMSRVTSESTNASLAISYEIDLWGRVAAGVAGSQASLQASEFDVETARLTLVANVANSYFQSLALAARLETAKRNLEVAERVLKVVLAKNRYGVATSLDVTRQQTTVLTQQTALVPLQAQWQQQLGALAVLLGRTPQAFALEPDTLAAIAAPQVAAGLPSDLLWRRPDLARTDADMRGAQANVAAAKAALLPSFSLSGSGGLGTATLLSLSNPSSTLGLTASLAYSLFDGGRQQAAVSIAESQRRVIIENGRKAVLTALKEVEDALGNAHRFEQEERAQQDIVRVSRLSLKSAELRYREGVDDLLTVLDTQRTLFQAEDQLLQAKLSRLTAAVDLYKALGGGWQSSAAPRQTLSQATDTRP